MIKIFNRSRLKSMSSFQVIIFSFLLLIIVGTVLLVLPISSRAGHFTPIRDAAFTAVSATCVTGLIVKDTATYWSFFGQAVILVLIQIGGMGVITIGLTILRVSGRKIGLWQRSTMQETISAPTVGGIVKLTGFLLKMSGLIELTGAALLSPVFIREFGVLKGIWYAVFHSISAFCNAGFDLMGAREPFSSLTSFSANIYVNIVVMMLIITGGIGFLVWYDVRTHKFKFKRYSLQSKIVLLTTLILIFVPAVYFFFSEYGNLGMCERILSSLFQSVTARTAGFNTQDLAQMHDSGKAVMIILMLIGGSPGSTAGGMKTTTVAVLFLSANTVFGRKSDVQCFKRRLSDENVRNAGAILFMYLILFFTTGVIVSAVDKLPLLTCLFETGSAIGTVGVTLGITAKLSLIPRILLMILMFFGRVGGLTMIYAAVPSADSQKARLPLDKVPVG